MLAIDELDLGIVNTDHSKTVVFYILNETPVPAHWQLNYVKFPAKNTIGHMTQTSYEIENSVSRDDPEVFSFSVTSGRLKGPSLKL